MPLSLPEMLLLWIAGGGTGPYSCSLTSKDSKVMVLRASAKRTCVYSCLLEQGPPN